MGSFGLKWAQIGPNWPIWVQMGSIGLKLAQIIGPRKTQMFWEIAHATDNFYLYTVLIFDNFSSFRILREINVGHF